MLSYIKKYPVSLFIILAVIYLSFFKPPSTEISKIPNIDKVVHRIVAGILYDLSWGRLDGLCSQYHRCGIGQSDRIFYCPSTYVK